MMKLAEEEHKALSNTLRDRLINSVTMRKIKLGKEKDELYNIGDSNALSLNPNQFTLNNPSSPGGVHGKRATRHRRDVDDLPGFPESHKRKRKAVDDIGSPVPSRRHIDNGFATPVWTTEQLARATNKGTNSPIYSVDKLFTEKELAMTYNQAAQAAYSLILQHKARYVNNDSDSASNDGDGPNTGDGDPDNEANDSPPFAPFMERQVSHATRSTRGLGLSGKFTTATGIDVLSDMTTNNNFIRMSQQISNFNVPKMPPLLSTVMAKAYIKESANTPPSLGNEELTLDLQNIERAKRLNEAGEKGENISRERGGPDREMLAAAVAEKGKYIAWIPNDSLDSQKHLPFQPKQRSNHTMAGGGNDGDEVQGQGMAMVQQGMGGVPMSKSSSMGGSEVAGGIGGVPMSRTASKGESSAMGKRRRGV
jgi:Sds3-like